jgi:hypothetical protein
MFQLNQPHHERILCAGRHGPDSYGPSLVEMVSPISCHAAVVPGFPVHSGDLLLPLRFDFFRR